jgi:NaMN:DMB phosphoribosyltransferase
LTAASDDGAGSDHQVVHAGPLSAGLLAAGTEARLAGFTELAAVTAIARHSSELDNATVSSGSP